MEKLKVLNFAPDEFRKELDSIKRQLPVVLEHLHLLAELRKASYDAYIEQGFTPDQALELCKKMV